MISDILSKRDEIVKKIIEKTKMSEDEVGKLIKEKKAEYGGLITDAGAAYSIAKAKGIIFESEERTTHFENIGKIGDKTSVNVLAKVMHIFAPREFEKDGRVGRVVNLTISDSTGSAKLVLWNEDVALVTENKIRRGDVVEVLGGRVKKREGDIELSVGMSSEIRPAEDDGSYPEIKETKLKIADITSDLTDFDVIGRVIEVFPERVFEKEGKEGKVKSMIIGDETGTIRTAIWSPVDLEGIIEGNIVKIEGAYAKKGQNGIEIHVGWKGRVIINPGPGLSLPKLSEFSDKRAKREFISDIKIGDECEIRGTIMAVYKSVVKTCPKCFHKVEGKCETCGSDGSDLSITNFDLDDGSGVIRVVIFGTMGDNILLEDIGTELIARGTAKQNEKMERLELSAKNISPPPDPKTEAEYLMSLIKK